MKWLRAALVAPLVLWAMLSPAIAFVGDTGKVGGPGGQEFHARCPPGAVIVGFAYIAAKDLNAIWINRCRALNGTRTDGPDIDMAGHYGDKQNNGYDGLTGSLTCPAPLAIRAISVTESSVQLVHTVNLTCVDLATGTTSFSGWSQTNGGKGGSPGLADCGGNGYATGFVIASGSLIDALGLTCAEYHAPATTAPAKPIKHTARGGPTTATPDKPPIKVLNGDEDDQNAGDGNDGDDGGNGGDAAGGTTAATDTTIYDQPDGNDVAYLSGGDPVTVVSCNDDNWCRISKPQKGWVWGDDLDR
jgi:hypothetical protein